MANLTTLTNELMVFIEATTGVKEHYCPQNNTAGRQYYTGTKLPGGGGGAGMYRYITASPGTKLSPINPIATRQSEMANTSPRHMPVLGNVHPH